MLANALDTLLKHTVYFGKVQKEKLYLRIDLVTKLAILLENCVFLGFHNGNLPFQKFICGNLCSLGSTSQSYLRGEGLDFACLLQETNFLMLGSLVYVQQS